MNKRQAKQIAKKLDEIRLLCKNPTSYPTEVRSCTVVPGQISNHRVELREYRNLPDQDEIQIADSIDGVPYKAGFNVAYVWIDGTQFWAYIVA